MIVVDYIKLKEAEIAFKIEVIKYMVFKFRLKKDTEKIGKVYPDSESIEVVPNKAVVSNHNYLVNTVNRLANSCLDKFDEYNDMRSDFVESLIN